MTNIFQMIGANAICRETHHELRSAQQRQYRMRCRVGLWISSVEKSELAIRLTANGRGHRIVGVATADKLTQPQIEAKLRAQFHG